MKTTKSKRTGEKMGRVTITLPCKIIDMIDELAEKEGLTRSGASEQLLKKILKIR